MGDEIDVLDTVGMTKEPDAPTRPNPPSMPVGPTTDVPLIRLAYTRSGDKGDRANIGILPRDPVFAGAIWNALSEEEIARCFEHYLDGPNPKVERFFMPGTGAMNILLHDVLGGGGVASLRNDPQAKTYGQILLDTKIPVPTNLLEVL